MAIKVVLGGVDISHLVSEVVLSERTGYSRTVAVSFQKADRIEMHGDGDTIVYIDAAPSPPSLAARIERARGDYMAVPHDTEKSAKDCPRCVLMNKWRALLDEADEAAKEAETE